MASCEREPIEGCQENRVAVNKRCGAHSRRSGEPCKNWALQNGRCRMHGGTNPGAPLKHGRRSKFLPAGLKEAYEELANDTELLTLQEDIRTVEAMLRDTLAAMRDHVGACWTEARALLETERLEELRELFDRGLELENLQEKFDRLTLQKARLVAVESRRMALMESSLNIKEQNALIAVLISAIAEESDEHVSNEARRRIQAKLLRQMPSTDS